MTKRLQAKLAAALFVATVATGAAGPAVMLAASPGHSQVDDINAMENRFFFRLYTRDPIEKRLERLELLVFGATQAGSLDERIARLSKTIKSRDTSSSGWAKEQSPEGEGRAQASGKTEGKAGGKSGSASAGKSSSQYPILNTLEWRALKKTYPDESIDERLERMESKLFGASSPAMAYADRVERLKRTLGVGVAQNLPNEPAGPLGPKPKARPRTSDLFEGMPAPGLAEPFNGFPTSPFGMMPGFGEMFKQMEKQMEQLRQMPSGTWEWDPESGSWIDHSNGHHFKPGPGQIPPEILPSNPKPGSPVKPHPFNVQPFKLTPTPDIPPYDDPNSI